MIIRRKILKGIILGIIFISVSSIWYINKFLAPTTLRNFFIKNISQMMNRPVSLKSVHFNLIRGIALNELTLYEPDGKTPFIKIERLSTTPLVIPLLKERQILLPSIHITSPYINIVKKQDGSWNFFNPPLIRKTAGSQGPSRKGLSFLVQRIQIDNGEINFLDNTKLPVYSKQIINLDAEVAFSIKEGAINFKTTSQLNIPEKPSIALNGSYLLGGRIFAAKGAVKNLLVSEPYEYFLRAAVPLDIKNGAANVSFDLTIDKNKKSELALNTLLKNLDVSGFGLNLKGDAGITGIVNSGAAETSQIDYKIELDFKGPSLSGVYVLNELSGLTGKIEILKDSIHSAGLAGLAHNTPVRFSGGIDLKDLILRLNTEASLDLANYRDFLPAKLKEQFKDIDLEGPAEVSIKFFDRLKDPQPVAVDGEVKLKGASLEVSAFASKFEKMSGEILFKNDTVYISRASFSYGAQNYILDSKITNLAFPDVKAKLKNQELSLDSRFQVLKDKLHILRLSGKYFNSSLNIAGDIEMSENPIMLMRGKLTADLADLRKIFPAVSPPLTRFDIKGICDLELYLNGPLKELRAAEAVLKGQSNMISFWDLKLNTVKLDLRMKDRHLLIQEFSARPYDGTFFSSMELDLTQENTPYVINLGLEGIDLGKVALDTDLKDKKISGKAMAKSNIRGYGKNTETIKGEGFIFIKGGRLWEIPLLRGMADLLFMPNLSSIVFDEASAHFAVSNKAISTSDLKLHSQNVGLLGEGNLYFDGVLDLLVTTSISENFLKGTYEFERLAGAFLAEAGQFMGRIKIGGTIKKPEYKFIPFPLDQVLKDKLKGLLGGFF